MPNPQGKKSTHYPFGHVRLHILGSLNNTLKKITGYNHQPIRI